MIFFTDLLQEESNTIGLLSLQIDNCEKLYVFDDESKWNEMFKYFYFILEL